MAGISESVASRCEGKLSRYEEVLSSTNIKEELKYSEDKWILPLEDLLMEYSSIGPRIRTNQFQRVKGYSLRCHFCNQYMTRKPMSLKDVKVYGTAIIEAHFVGLNNHVLAINTLTQIQDLNDAVKENKFELRICMGMKQHLEYRKVWKATMLDYSIKKETMKKRCEFTRLFFKHFVLEYLRPNVLEDYFNRAIRSSASSIATLDKKVRTRNNKQETMVNFQVPPEFEHIIWDTSVKVTKGEKREKETVKKIMYNDSDEEIRKNSAKKSPKPYSRKRKSKTNQKTVGDKYTDDDIKLNWSTLMCFNYDAMQKGTVIPKCLEYHDFDSNPIHYVGMSIINNKKVHFEVSTNIIPVDNTSYIFSDQFLRSIGFNREVQIEDSSKEKLRNVVQTSKSNRILCIIPQDPKDGTQFWKMRYESGRNPKYKDASFIERNFKNRFPSVYKRLMDENNIGKEIKLPAGSRKGKPKESGLPKVNNQEDNNDNIFEENMEDDEDDVIEEVIPSEFATVFNVEFQFGNKSFCAFGNMANALFECGDKDAAQWFFMNRYQDYSVLEHLYIDSNNKSSLNEFYLSLQIVRQHFQYNVRFLGNDDRPWDHQNTDRDVVKLVHLHKTESFCTHVVCICNNFIIDGSFRYFVKLSELSLKWICNNSSFVATTYSIEPSPARQRKIDEKKNNKNEKNQKKKKN